MRGGSFNHIGNLTQNINIPSTIPAQLPIKWWEIHHLRSRQEFPWHRQSASRPPHTILALGFHSFHLSPVGASLTPTCSLAGPFHANSSLKQFIQSGNQGSQRKISADPQIRVSNPKNATLTPPLYIIQTPTLLFSRNSASPSHP